MSDDDLTKLVDEMAARWGVGGMDATTIYGQFAIEVAKEAMARLIYSDDETTLPVDTDAHQG